MKKHYPYDRMTWFKTKYSHRIISDHNDQIYTLESGIRVDCLNLWSILCIFIVFVFFIGQSQLNKSDIKIHDSFLTKACQLHTEGLFFPKIMYELTNF